jgi:hypothetical protein
MKAVAGQLLGIVVLLIGAAFVVAAFGGLGPIGIQSLPQQWVLGLAGLLGGRLLIAQALRTRTAGSPIAIGLEARIEEITNIPLHQGDSASDATTRSGTASKP